MGKIIRNTLILTIITVVAGLGLGLVYEVTKEPIARTEEQAKKEAWQTVFSDVSLAIDIIGAGIGEYVLVAQGSAARIGCGVETAPVDAAIVGIVDDGAGLE